MVAHRAGPRDRSRHASGSVPRGLSTRLETSLTKRVAPLTGAAPDSLNLAPRVRGSRGFAPALPAPSVSSQEKRPAPFFGSTVLWQKNDRHRALGGYVVVLGAVLLLAAVVPTRRALRVEPAEALREEG